MHCESCRFRGYDEGVDAVRGVRLVICALILTFLALPIYFALVPLDGDYSEMESVQYTRTVEVTVETPSDNSWPTLPKMFTPMLERYVMPDDPAVRQVADALHAHADRWDYSERRTADLARRWVVSNITYVSDSDSHGISDYWQTPSETLRLGTGDCEDSVVLFASICGALGIDTVIVSEPGHVSAGVMVDEKAGDVTISYGGCTYVAVETTSDAPLGSMKLGPHIVYPTNAGLAVILILLADILVIGLVVCLLRSIFFRK